MADQDQEAAEDAGDTTERAEPSALAKKPSDKTEDLDKTRDALVEAAAVSSGLWITYLGVLLYLTIAVGSVTHRDLFLESPITLPFVSVKLPMAGFFVLGPGLFLIVHAYVLLHFAMLAGKVEAFDVLLITSKFTPEAQATLRQRLPANVFVQFLAGPPKIRDGLIGLFLWLIALITLVAGPILLLLFFELQFLPYHDEIISWWQRIAVGIDLGLLWLFWPRIAVRKTDPDVKGETRFRVVHRLQSAGSIGIMLILSLGSLPLLLLIATFPGEKLQQTVQDWVEKPARAWISAKYQVPVRVWLVAGRPNELTRRPDSLFSDRLVLPGLDVIDHAKYDTDAKIATAPETVSLRGRELQGAVLIGADLRRIDFTRANLQGASLNEANLQDANLVGAHLEGADLSYAHLERANLSCGFDHSKAREGADPHCADLRDAFLSHTYLNGADLRGAELHGADLNGADFHGTNLSYADLHGADLRQGHLRGANLSQAHLQGADFSYAALQGADLSSAGLQGADLSTTHLQGADLRHANLQGADLGGAGLQGVDLRDADLQGGNLRGTDLQGAALTQAHLEGADLSHAGLQGADLTYAHLQGVTLNEVFVWGTKVAVWAAGLDGAWVGAIDTQPWNQKIDAFPTLPEAIAQIIRTIPAGDARESAKSRLDQLLSLKGEDGVFKTWRDAMNLGKPPGFDNTVDDTWSRIGCDAEGAPYVMSNLIGRFSDLADKGKAVATQFLDKDCQGRKGLSAEDLDILKKISASGDLGLIRGAHAEAQGTPTAAFSAPALPPASETAASAPAPVFEDLSDRSEREVATPVAPAPWPHPARHSQHAIHTAPNGKLLTLTRDTTALLNQHELARHSSVASTSDNSISSFFRSLFH
jgi:uncharacterized protein YjbI with pentapeptide repeats